jgi:ribosomal protein S12 methylthiotransferase RimO
MKIYFDTLGCPKNFNDTEMAMGILEENGHSIADEPKDADVIVVNTCGFINDAKRESIDAIFDMSEFKKNGKKLVVSGCLAQRYADELYKEMPEVDGFIGVNDYEKLPELVSSLFKAESERFKVIDPCNVNDLENDSRKLADNPYSATIKIAEGCNNVCAYCVIPQIRGPYRSRPKEKIVAEAERLAKAGCKELILIAQDVTYYGQDIYGSLELPGLLKELCKVDGIQWIRLLYCYEDRISDELIDVMASESKICNYIDIPIQHASDSVLADMNRRSTAESIDNTLRRLKNKIPDIHIRTTLIVGFPGETEEDYDKLVAFVEKEKFARLGVFAYSREEGTPAAEMENQVPDEVKQVRLDGIMMRQIEISLALNREKIGRTLEVIVDERDDDGSYIGRTRYDAPEIDNSVVFVAKTEHVPGDIVNVEILDAFDYDLEGREV